MVKIQYPQEAFMVMIPLYVGGDEVEDMYPVMPIFSQKDMAVKYARELVETEDLEPYFQQNLVMAKLTFNRSWPLKKEYFDHPSLEYSVLQRKTEMIKMFAAPQFYELLITPSDEQTTTEGLMLAALPVSAGNDRDVEAFMQNSDWPVYPGADAAALYKIERVFGYDLENGEETENEIEVEGVVN